MRNDTLLAAIRADREDPAPYLVYADWLIAKGDPLGELIVLHHGDDSAAKTARREALLAAQAIPDKYAHVEMRHGLWRSLHLWNDDDWMDEAFDAIAPARALFALSSCDALERLALGVLRWDHNAADVPAVLAEAGRHAWAAHLERLHLGDLSGVDVDMAHHVVGEVGAVITASFPALRELIVHSGEQTWRGEGETFGIAGLRLPMLARLVIETCSMTAARLADVLAAELPALRELELWFGSDREGADAGVADLAPLLDGTRFPNVTRLGLRNAEFTDALAHALPDSAIAARLESLDLSMGILTDDGALALAAGAARFPRLARLVVDDNFVREPGLTALRAAFRDVVSDSQKDDDDSIPGEIHRYVSVAE